MDPFDVTVYHAINGLAGHNRLLDDAMIFFAKYALEIYAGLFVVSWLALPKRAIQTRHAIVMAGLAGIVALCINVIIAHFWYRSRPFVLLPKGSFHQLIPHAADSSFPSDHTSGSFAFAAATWGKGPRWMQWAFTSIAVIVMFARVFVGVHWPTDVLASVVIGSAAGRSIWLFSRFVYPITIWVARVLHLAPSRRDSDTATNSLLR